MNTIFQFHKCEHVIFTFNHPITLRDTAYQMPGGRFNIRSLSNISQSLEVTWSVFWSFFIVLKLDARPSSIDMKPLVKFQRYEHFCDPIWTAPRGRAPLHDLPCSGPNRTSCLHSLCTELFWWNIKFISVFFHFSTLVELISQRLVYPTKPISWPPMACRYQEPGNQLPYRSTCVQHQEG